ncbi:hypothetical protein SAMN02746065_1213 [Desulfocicer vacuolatum DSM 3385]|uniref:Uncharacterized protein n=1 Tax=Desulfocicer vacuolatum DSM 3385 TaxID=1121400 RepID=A0A1W2DWT1_9BACT|nr:hypothetical protein SAMN02746065_1213 [Desulfocicer vacuolatum DSM 3385]
MNRKMMQKNIIAVLTGTVRRSSRLSLVDLFAVSVSVPCGTPGMGVNLWDASPLYVNPINQVTVNTSIIRKQERNREEPSEGSWSAKL